MADNTTVFTEDFASVDHSYTTTAENDVQTLAANYVTHKIGKLL